MNRLQLIDYDGINLFFNGKWTTLEYDTIEEGRMRVAALSALSDKQVAEWIQKAVFQKNLTDINNCAWNILKEVEHE